MKKFLDKISIKYRLLIMVLIPLIGLVYFSGKDIVSKTKFSGEITKIQNLTSFSVKASALVHELQKERGASAGFLGSQGRQFVTELPAQHSNTDHKLAEFQEFLMDFDKNSYGKSFAEFVGVSEAELSKIRTIRKGVLDLDIQTGKAIGFYTNLNAQLLNAITEVAKLSPDPEIAVLYSTYSNFLKGKERAGIERAVMSNVFASGEFKGGLFNRFSSLVAQQNAFIGLFRSFADEDQLRFFEQKMSDPAVAEVERMRDIAFSEEEKKSRFSELPALMGYDRFIHHFKNYVIQGSPNDKNIAEQSLAQAIKTVDASLKGGDLSKQTEQDLKTIRATLAQYQGLLGRVTEMKAARRSVATINQTVRIDDEKASAALMRLTHSDFKVDAVHWFKTMTKKINLLKEVEDKLTADLLGVAGRLQSGIQTVYIVTFVVVLITILIAIFFITNINGLLRNLIMNLNSSADQLAAASSEISDSSQQLSQGATEQAASLEETSSSMEQISKQTQVNADTANNTAQSMSSITEMVQKATDNSKNASGLSEDAYNSAENGVQAMGEISGALNQISQDSAKITDIIEVINEITHQTKMLATNAAIEAARAGEQGKGFAVVADEVSKLAENSKNAAKEISSLIKESVKRAQGSTELAGKGEEVLQSILSKSKEVAQLMKDIMGSSENQARQIREVEFQIQNIKSASDEQAKGVQQVSEAIIEMDKVTQTNAANSEETASAAEELSAQAENLRDTILGISKLVGFHGKGSTGIVKMKRHPETKKQPLQYTANIQRTMLPPAGQNKKLPEGRLRKPSESIPLRDDFQDF